MYSRLYAEMAELADASALRADGGNPPCGFNSHSRHSRCSCSCVGLIMHVWSKLMHGNSHSRHRFGRGSLAISTQPQSMADSLIA